MVSKVSTPYLTSYDLLKSLALLLMVLDHAGYFFFPGNDWFRAVGRACVPIWFFLIGYAQARDLSKPLWAGAGLLILASFIFGSGIFPLNILVTIILVRLVLNRTAAISFRGWESMIYSALLLSILYLPTMFVFEYGTMGLLLALCGYILRHEESLSVSKRAQMIYMGFVIILFSFSQLIIFGMAKEEGQLMVVGIGLVALLLYRFRPDEVPEVENRLPGFIVSGLQIGGRYTLEIYIVHLVAFNLIACLAGLKGYGWFNWVWIR